MNSSTLNDIGLILDILGAILLFLYGIAPQLNREGAQTLEVGTSISEKLLARTYDIKAKAGVGLLILGFALQLLSNHLDSQPVRRYGWPVLIILGLSILAAAIIFIRRYLRNRIRLVGQYIPQFNYDEHNRNRTHLWQFEFTNNTRNVLIAPELQLPYKVKRVDLLLPAREPKNFEETDCVTLTKLGPFQTATFRVWNMGSNGGTGDDTYMRVDKKIIRAQLLEAIRQD